MIGKKGKQRTPAELIRQEKEKAYIGKVYSLTKALAVAVLYDRFDFTEEQAQDFLADFDYLVQSVGYGDDNLETIRKNIKEYIGADV